MNNVLSGKDARLYTPAKARRLTKRKHRSKPSRKCIYPGITTSFPVSLHPTAPAGTRPHIQPLTNNTQLKPQPPYCPFFFFSPP